MTAPSAAGPPPVPPLPEPEQRGRTTIADRAVERVAAAAAAEVELATGSARRVLGVPVSAADLPRVTARVHGDEATVEVDLAVAWPAPVRQVARRVRARVVEQLTDLVGLRDVRVDVRISALVPERAAEQRRVV